MTAAHVIETTVLCNAERRYCPGKSLADINTPIKKHFSKDDKNGSVMLQHLCTSYGGGRQYNNALNLRRNYTP